MPSKQKRSATKDTSAAFRDALWHPSVLLIIGSSILLSSRSRWGVLHLDVSALASYTFSVAGTMVALILPASQLVNSVLIRLDERMIAKLKDPNSTPDQKYAAGNRMIEGVQPYLAPAWRASAFVFVSFLLSITAMIFPEIDAHLGPLLVLPLRSLAVVLSILFLIVGSTLFLPAAWYSFDPAILDTWRENLVLITDYEKAKLTKAQSPMVIKWRKHRTKSWKWRIILRK